jgi:hypothetical protein
MASFDTIDLLDGNVFQVTWDTGRRCNYDCSYCPAHRHDNFSPHATLEDLIKNLSPDFLVIGDDYKDKKIIGSVYAKNIIFFNKLPNYSTTNILNYGK